MAEFNMDVLKNHAVTYFMAKAHWETVKETAAELEKEVLAEHEFYEDPKLMSEWGFDSVNRILDPKHSYVMDKESAQKYDALCYEKYLEAGIADKRGVGYCPDNEARDMFYEAEKALIDYAIETMPDEVNGVALNKDEFRKGMRSVKFKKQFLDIVLGLANVTKEDCGLKEVN